MLSLSCHPSYVRVLCRCLGLGSDFDWCAWDGVRVVEATPAPDDSYTTITSDPSRLCVSCVNTAVGTKVFLPPHAHSPVDHIHAPYVLCVSESDAAGFVWDNLPCEPSLEWSDVVSVTGADARASRCR